jgi:integrase
MGNLHKRNGVFYADYIDRSGKRQQPSLRTRDPVVARTRLRDLELATTDRAPQKTEALDVALSYFIDVTCAAKPAATVRCYRQKAGHLSRLLGDLLLDSLSRENVERFIAIRLGEDAAKHTIHKELVVLRGALKAAEARDRFHHGVHNVVPRFDAEYEPRRTYLTPEQFMRLTENLLRPIGTGASEAQRTRWEARRVRRTFYVLFMALASERLGEVEQMDWRNVDLHRNVIVVPDGKTGSRVVRIHPVLRLWIERYQQEAGPITEGWTNIGRDLPAACARAGVPRCTANDLRRTFASWLVQSGETLYVVSKLLGHKSTRMVELVYGQLDEATLSRAIDRLPGGSHAGYTDGLPNRGAGGVAGTAQSSTAVRNSVDTGVVSESYEVPRDGVEPPTRGFSVPLPNDAKPVRPRVKLKLVG